MNVATVNISFPKDLLREIDAVALEESRTRSDLLREATRLYIERKRRLSRMFAFWKREAKGLTADDVENAVSQVRHSR